ncbi:MAG: hypothetical protein LBR85_01560 [Oscillospiraceae bacterium]|nr:hypothetical protein [Oscillospiraceae bacterium]
MKKKFLRRCLLLTPVIVLCGTLFFLNYTIQLFKDTAYKFVYDTNIGSVQRFTRELRELTAQGYSSKEYSDLYTVLINSYNKTLGEKDAIVTFLLDEDGAIRHSSEENQNYLSVMLEDDDNMTVINSAFAAMGEGEISLKNGGRQETLYYSRYYSDEYDYCLFMTVDREVVNADPDLHANGVVIPICLIGLLLLFTLEGCIYHLIKDGIRDSGGNAEQDKGTAKQGEEDAN